jgi:hypothetical protein
LSAASVIAGVAAVRHGGMTCPGSGIVRYDKEVMKETAASLMHASIGE